MKEYIKNGITGDIKDILKIRLDIRDVKWNYPKNENYVQFAKKKKIQQNIYQQQNLRKENT